MLPAHFGLILAKTATVLKVFLESSTLLFLSVHPVHCHTESLTRNLSMQEPALVPLVVYVCMQKYCTKAWRLFWGFIRQALHIIICDKN